MANFAGILKKAFPFISAAASFGGPLGTMAANAVGQALGMNKPPDATPDAIGQVVAGATQAQINDLAQIEADLKAKMAALGVQSADDLENLATQDRADARAREIAVRDKTPRNMAYLTLIAAIVVAIVSIKLSVNASLPVAAASIMGTITGYVFRDLGAVYNYLYGTSRGSDDKNETINTAVNKLN